MLWGQKQAHALVKAPGFLGSVCVWLTSLLWCLHMCYWRPLFLARPATNFVSKFWPVPLWSLRFLASGSSRPKHGGKWKFYHSPCLLFLICFTIQTEWICPKKPTCGTCNNSSLRSLHIRQLLGKLKLIMFHVEISDTTRFAHGRPQRALCTEAVHSVALWTRLTLGLGMCDCVPKQSIPEHFEHELH